MAKTFEAMQKNSMNSLSGWQYFNLKDMSQIGTLDKKILQLQKKNGYKIFNFCSSRHGEGVSTILANLTNYFKNQHPEKKILVIDANFQSPMLHHIFNLDNRTGLFDLLSQQNDYSASLPYLDSTNISVLTTGQQHDNQIGNLNIETFSKMLHVYEKFYDYIFIDSAPMLKSSDAVSTAIASNVTFLIIQSTIVQKEVALQTKRLLSDNECIIGGVLLNKIRQVIPKWIYNLT